MASNAHHYNASILSAAKLDNSNHPTPFPSFRASAPYGSINSSRTSFTSVNTLRQEDVGSHRNPTTAGSSVISIISSDNAPLLSRGRSNSTAFGSNLPRASLNNARRASAPMPYGGGRIRKLFSTSHPLLEAAKSGDIESVRSLANRETAMIVDSRDNWTALHYAAAFGYHSIVQVLLPFYDSVDPRTKRQDRTPLFLAVQAGQLLIAESLIDAGSDLVASSRIDMATPLHRAALEGDEAMVKMLLDRGAPVNALDIEGMRPLMWAVQGGNPRIAEILVLSGAELEGRTQTSGLTVLHRAVGSRDARMVGVLLKLGANANADAPLGMRCLHRAATAGDIAIVQMLLKEPGVDIDARTVKNWTPLHSAARNGHLSVYQALLDAGANKDAVNVKGLTAIGLARKWGYENIS